MHTPDARDSALAEQLYIGVVKNLLLLQNLIEHFSGHPLGNIDPIIQKILAIALYQMRFLTRIPASAAVNEAVEQVKRFGHPRAAGMVNAVLRNATRQPSPADPTNPADFARLVLSHPGPLYERACQLLGADGALQFCHHNNAQPPLIVRISPGVDPSALVDALVNPTPHQQPGFFVIEQGRRSLLARWADENLAYVQDPTAGSVVPLCDIRAGMTVLDRCCGLGTKTIQLRQLLGDTGRLFAMDPSPQRMEILSRVIESHGWANVQLLPHAWFSELPVPLSGKFDRILIDAPCSNSGVLARRPEARYHQTAASTRSLTKIQLALLDDCVPHLAHEGLIVYSTCSIWPDENEQCIAAFLKAYPNFKLIVSKTTYPSSAEGKITYHDGGYYAVLLSS